MLPTVFGEKLFDTFFGQDPFSGMESMLHRSVFGKHADAIMKTDVRQLENSYELDVDLPGFKKEEVGIELDGGYLTISAAKSHESEQKDEAQYLRKERYSGSCSRSFYVGNALEAKDVTAKFEDGILRLSFPKNPEPKLPEAKRIAIA